MKMFRMLLVDENDWSDIREKILELKETIYDGKTYPMPVKAKAKLNEQINDLLSLIEPEGL